MQICSVSKYLYLFISEKVQGKGSDHSDSVEKRPSPILVLALGPVRRSIVVELPGTSRSDRFVA